MAGLTALDIPETQVLINFDDDVHFVWHQRVLVVKLTTGSQWVGFTADLEPEVVDLSLHQVIVLTRGARFPPRVLGNAYGLARISERERDDVLRECFALGDVLGAAPGARPAGAAVAEFRFSDTAHEKFGELVPAEVLRDPNTMVVRGPTALVRIDDDGEQVWTTAERVLSKDVSDWTQEKRNGPGRDPRILSVMRDMQDTRFRPLRETLGELSFVEGSWHRSSGTAAPSTAAGGKTAPSDWPLPGPSALKELLKAVRATGEEVAGFHDYFCRSAGLAHTHPVAVKHRDLLSILHHLLAFDQVNAGELAGCELLARMVLQIHAATRKSPKAPDFRGTQMMVMSALDSSGGVLTGEFARRTAEKRKNYAFALKQQRLFSEEDNKHHREENKPHRQGKAGGKGDE